MPCLFLWLGCPPVAPAAGDPPQAGAKKGVAGRDEPPPCEHMAAERPKAKARAATARRSGQTANAPGPFGTSPNGFIDVLKQQEAAALQQTRLSLGEERRIGRQQRDQYLARARDKGFTARQVGKDTDYLQALVEKLAKRMKNRERYPEIEITIVDAPIPDGQSFAGGYLVFTKALLQEPDEATVAGVVAHELAHLDRGHLFQYAKRDKLANEAFQFGPDMLADPSRFMMKGMALGSLMMDPFRPEDEHEADCVATTWLYQEGYSPDGLADFFTRMNERLRDQPENPYWKIGRSHPYSLARRRAVLDRLGQLQRWKPRDDLKREANALADRKVAGN